MQEQQKFQSQAQLTALKIHAVWEKVEAFFSFPFRWLAEQCSQTEAFRERPALKVVK